MLREARMNSRYKGVGGMVSVPAPAERMGRVGGSLARTDADAP